jgi:hypothetical protein
MKQLLLSLLLALTATTMRAAEGDVWCMVTESGQSVALSQVHYLLSLGANSESFTIVLRDGSTIDNVTKVTFSQTTPSAISPATMTDETALHHRIAGSELVLMGCPEGSPVSIVALSGKTLLRSVTSGRQTTIDISSLAKGVYILSLGQTNLKFMKR